MTVVPRQPKQHTPAESHKNPERNNSDRDQRRNNERQSRHNERPIERSIERRLTQTHYSGITMWLTDR